MNKSAKSGAASKSGATSKSGKSTSASNSASNTTDSDKTISTTTTGFRAQATANGILHPLRSMPAHNAGEILERLSRRRDSASPTELQYQRYRRKIRTAGNEAAVVHRMLSLFKDYDDEYNVDMTRALSALPQQLGFNNGLSAPRPDFIEGPSKEEFLPVDPSIIQGAVLFKDDATSITLPHLAGEWKSRSGNMDVATLQSGYDGAAMVYGRNQAQEYLGDADAIGYSHVITFTSNGEHITFFAHHALPTGEDGKVEYHQHYLARTDLTDSYESFKKGRRQIRNAQDYAREQSFALRDQLRKQRRLQRRRRRSAVLRTPAPAPAAMHPKADGNEGDEVSEESEDYAGDRSISMPNNRPMPPVSTPST